MARVQLSLALFSTESSWGLPGMTVIYTLVVLFSFGGLCALHTQASLNIEIIEKQTNLTRPTTLSSTFF